MRASIILISKSGSILLAGILYSKFTIWPANSVSEKHFWFNNRLNNFSVDWKIHFPWWHKILTENQFFAKWKSWNVKFDSHTQANPVDCIEFASYILRPFALINSFQIEWLQMERQALSDQGEWFRSGCMQSAIQVMDIVLRASDIRSWFIQCVYWANRNALSRWNGSIFAFNNFLHSKLVIIIMTMDGVRHIEWMGLKNEFQQHIAAPSSFKWRQH